MSLTTAVDVLNGRVDKEHASLSIAVSRALITLGLPPRRDEGTPWSTVTDEEAFTEKHDLAVAFWQTVAASIDPWVDVAAGRLDGTPGPRTDHR